MIVDLAGAPLQRLADVDFSDLTASTLTGEPRWLNPACVELPFEPEPTTAEARLIRRRMVTTDEQQEALVTNLVGLRDELAASTSTTATMRAVKALLDMTLAPFGEAS